MTSARSPRYSVGDKINPELTVLGIVDDTGRDPVYIVWHHRARWPARSSGQSRRHASRRWCWARGDAIQDAHRPLAFRRWHAAESIPTNGGSASPAPTASTRAAVRRTSLLCRRPSRYGPPTIQPQRLEDAGRRTPIRFASEVECCSFGYAVASFGPLDGVPRKDTPPRWIAPFGRAADELRSKRGLIL
jgi:hypothetical protein